MTNDLTVKGLREVLDGLPDDTPVRIEPEAGRGTDAVGFIFVNNHGLVLTLASSCCPHVR